MTFRLREDGLHPYLDEIRTFPMLAPTDEFMLAKRWREHGDHDAVDKLVTSHLRLVAKIAMGYRGYGLPIAEVVSEGNVGLMQAVKRFQGPPRLYPTRRAPEWTLAPGAHAPAPTREERAIGCCSRATTSSPERPASRRSRMRSPPRSCPVARMPISRASRQGS